MGMGIRHVRGDGRGHGVWDPLLANLLMSVSGLIREPMAATVVALTHFGAVSQMSCWR